ncbi:MAG: hypothetical protein MJ124_05790 [Lachnospiraceae bacterium]|nr:hypothetical protein [Lachnospiraceae bacterium]
MVVLSACGKKPYEQAIPIPTPTETPYPTAISIPAAVPTAESEPVPTAVPEESKAPTPTPIPSPAGLPEQVKSLEQFLRNAMKPVGSTLYVWGGGWNEEDTGSGEEAVSIGLSGAWKEFFIGETKNYDYNKHLYKIHDGLDCSGYVGWTLYNTLESDNGKEGYVTKAVKMAESLADRELGTIVDFDNSLLPGDIVSMSGHVYIALGTCEDGSVLLVHSSPPGVRISGTAKADGSTSIATQMAWEYTKNHYPEWFERYNKPENYQVSSSYLKDIKVFRWGKDVFEDADEIEKLSPAQVLQMLSGLSEKIMPLELRDNSEYKMYLNSGNGELCEAQLQIEHMLKYKDDAEYLEFNCRLIISDEAAFNEGYNYLPFVTDSRNLQENLATFSHIKSGVYEDHNERKICDSFSCKIPISEGTDNYLFGFINTATNMSPDYRPTGDNHLILFSINPDEAPEVKKSSEQLKVGDFVTISDEENAEIWYVMAEDDQGYRLITKNLIALNGSEQAEKIMKTEGYYLRGEEEIISYLWKNDLGYDTIIAAEPTKNCYEEIKQFWGTEPPEDLVFYHFALNGEGEYCGPDGTGNVNNGGGSLLSLIGLRPCCLLKK